MTSMPPAPFPPPPPDTPPSSSPTPVNLRSNSFVSNMPPVDADWSNVSLIHQPGKATWPITLPSMLYVPANATVRPLQGQLTKALVAHLLSEEVQSMLQAFGEDKDRACRLLLCFPLPLVLVLVLFTGCETMKLNVVASPRVASFPTTHCCWFIQPDPCSSLRLTYSPAAGFLALPPAARAAIKQQVDLVVTTDPNTTAWRFETKTEGERKLLSCTSVS